MRPCIENKRNAFSPSGPLLQFDLLPVFHLTWSNPVDSNPTGGIQSWCDIISCCEKSTQYLLNILYDVLLGKFPFPMGM